MRSIFSKCFIKSASYNKMKEYMYTHDTITLSADKEVGSKSSDNSTVRSKDDNKYWSSKLFTELRNLCNQYGWKVFPIYGGYTEYGAKSTSDDSYFNKKFDTKNGMAKSKIERSYMIVNLSDNPDFYNIVVDFMKNFDNEQDVNFKQEAIAYYPRIGEGQGKLRYLRDVGDTKEGEEFEIGTFHDKVNPEEGGGFTSPRRSRGRYAFGYS